MPTLERGVQFAKHRILRCIGEGTFAETYEVIDPTGARRALKVLNPELSPASKPAARLGQEAEAIAMCEHVNVVRYYDVGVEHGRPWILMELVEGHNLHLVLKDAGGRLPVARAVTLVRHPAEGAAAVHQLDIVHRDLKPENILVTADEVAKIADFGWARMSKWGVKTSTEEEIGSALYTAPEYMRGRDVGPKMDVYTLGVVLYELISGVNPIVQGPATMMKICELHLTYDAPPLASLGLDVPGDVSHLVARTLAKSPLQRPTMREFADGLALVLSRLNVQRRASARSVPLPNREPSLALTEPSMAAWVPEWGSPAPASLAAATPPVTSVPTATRGGTTQMPASATSIPRDWTREAPETSGGCLPSISASEHSTRDTERDAVVPPAPSALPETLRTPSYSTSAHQRTEIMQVMHGIAPVQVVQPKDVVPAAPPERGSTGIPVEAAVSRHSATPRALSLVAVGVALISIGLVGGWLLFGRGSSSTPASAAVSAPTTVSPTLSPPSASASASNAKPLATQLPSPTPKPTPRRLLAPIPSGSARSKLPFQ